MKHKIAIERRSSFSGKLHAKLRCKGSPLRVDIDQRDLCARQMTTQKGHQTTQYATTYHCDSIAWAWCSVPHSIQRGFHIRGQDGSLGWDRLGYRHDRVGGQIKIVLMRAQAKYATIEQLGRATLHPTHRGIAILDWKREVSAHKWCAHTRKFSLRDFASKH